MTWTDLLIESSLRPMAIAAAVALTILACRVRSTSAQLRLWTLVLASAVVMPALVATPSIRVPVAVLPSSWTVTPAGTVAPRVAQPDARDATVNTSIAGPRDEAATPAATGWTWSTVLVAIYGAGLAVLLGRALLGWFLVVRLERSSTEIDDEAARDRFAVHAGALGLRRIPRLAAHGRLFVPISTSVWRPAILLPDDWRTWPPVKLDAVFVHELAHVARRDALMRRVSSIYRACFWFSPLAWWLHHRIASLSERASDEAALESGVDPAIYAATLLDFFRVPQRPQLASWHLAMARGRGAERRVEWILDWEAPMTRRMKLTMVLLGFVLGPAVLTASMVRPVAIPQSTIDTPVEVSTIQPPTAPAVDRVVAPAPAARTDARRPAAGGQAPPRQPGTLSQHEPQAAQAAPPSSPPQAAVRPGPGITSPVLVRMVEPRYPAAAQAAKVQGSVEIEAVIGVDGTITDLRVTRSLDRVFGLDAEAVRVAREWLFRPGTRDEKPVPVTVTLVIEFRLDRARTAEQRLFDDAIADDAPGLVKPELLRSVEARYTPDALRAKIQGIVEVEVVVQPDGTVGAARIRQSLDSTFGLDDSALQAARAWLYRPGTLNGQAVPVLTRVSVSFRIH